ncbi:hypothetical protein GCM10011491_05570 [Brucella endophytica]|uniref:Uncharacterized protein n=1 Tax=Brucella endophytica TaxID=1963359 RepID=A0A916WAW1_9HYPH|nr:hypothetical protein [Brucella endophytica]GGA81167.1 hypothetical protein GCM10011491_05570 [Brucella endophytica]
MSAIDRLEKTMVAALEQTLASNRPVIISPGGALFWEWFMDLSATRTWHMNGPNPISYTEIMGYSHINRWSIQPHHVAIIRAMDAAYIEHFYARQANVGKSDSAVPQPTGELTTELFDAVFG